jgi:hypothetical protein
MAEFEGTGTFLESTFQPIDESKEPEPFVPEDGAVDLELEDCFRQLAALLATEKSEPFKKCHYLLRNDGKYRADYEY